MMARVEAHEVISIKFRILRINTKIYSALTDWQHKCSKYS